MKKTLIRNGEIFTGIAEETFRGNILVEGDRIKTVSREEITGDFDRTINAEGKAVMPGLVNCHTHAAMTMFRSYADDMELMKWLEELIWPREAHLAAEDVYWGTMVAVAEMIRSGTTCFADMYFFMEETARAVEESGMRAVLSRGLIGFTDRNGASLRESRELFVNWDGQCDGRITCMLGPHAPYTCDPEYMEKILLLAEDLDAGLHIHIAETENEIGQIREKYGKTPVEYFLDMGALDRKVLAAHCVHVTEKDMDILREKKVSVSHNPSSNMKLASGIAPVDEMLKKGITVGIGTDGTSSNNNLNMFEEIHLATMLQKVGRMDATVLPAAEVLKMATSYGAKALGLDETGVLEEGKKADIILVDTDSMHFYPRHNLVSNLAYSAQGSDVDTVMVNGKVLFENGKFTEIDEEKIKFNVEKRKEILFA